MCAERRQAASAFFTGYMGFRNIWKQVTQIKRKYVIYFCCLIVIPLILLGCNYLDSGYGEAVDSDGDGWSDVQEEKAGTNPSKTDTDGDGYWDPKDDNPLDPDIPYIIQPAPTPTPDETEAAATEFRNVQSAVVAMMVDNQLSTLPTPVAVATDNMSLFPDTTAAASKGTDRDGNTYDANDKAGFILYQHDIIGSDGSDKASLVNYVATKTTKGTYTVDASGTVTQVTYLTIVPLTPKPPVPAPAPTPTPTPTPDETEAAATEFANVHSAVVAMMVDNQLSTLPTPVTVATDNMSLFPDVTSACTVVGQKVNDPDGTAYTASDKDGFILYKHDIEADSAVNVTVNYVATEMTKGTYTVDASGTVTQVTTGYE